MNRLAGCRGLNQAVERARLAEQTGYDSIWLCQLPNERDTSLVLADYAPGTERIGLGSYFFPIYTRHPTVIVQMVATLDELSGGRFVAGRIRSSALAGSWQPSAARIMRSPIRQ